MVDLVYIDDYGLLGSNFYWENRERLNINKKDLIDAGLTDGRAQVSPEIIPALQSADKKFQEQGHRLYVKDGYRSPEVYALAYTSRTEKFGQEQTDLLMNMEQMPHATGRVVDIALWDPQTNQEVATRDKSHGVQAMFVDFYKNQDDSISKQYQRLQELMIQTMLDSGFQLGEKNEYFHFQLADTKLA